MPVCTELHHRAAGGVDRHREADPLEAEPVPLDRIWALIPITSPRASNSGPPELPWLIGASVWIASTRLYCVVSEGIERRIAETTPTESESSLPNGLPIAATGCADDDTAESPSGTGSSGCAPGRP